MTATEKRSLTHVGGDVEIGGDREAGALLAHALDVPPSSVPSDDDSARAHVHGFHTYPARMHPATASRLIRRFSAPRARVFDPFCGSGTVLVEAMLAGRDAVGSDLNPLAVRLGQLKTTPTREEDRAAMIVCAKEVASFADDRRKKKAGATRRYPSEDVQLFDPHVLLELDSLRAGIWALKNARSDGASAPRRGQNMVTSLGLVLSALLVKLSRKRSDTSNELEKRRIAAGYTAKLFVRKTEELTRLLAEFADALPRPPPKARVVVDDASELRHVKPKMIDAIITSPPYAATYDYLAQHALRLRWLGLDARPFEEKEMGARRRYTSLEGAAARTAWRDEMGLFLRQMADVLPKDGTLVLIMGDSAVGRVALRAEEIVAEVAKRASLVPFARASQDRPHFHGPSLQAFAKAPRREHALLLLKT